MCECGPDYSVCDKCNNNPKNNPRASGICSCTLPYMNSTTGNNDFIYTTNTTTNYVYTVNTILTDNELNTIIVNYAEEN